MSKRDRIGMRNHVIQTLKHGGTRNIDGDPDYENADAWTATGSFFAEVLTTSGNEVVRGRQVSSQTRFVLFSEYFSAMSPVAISPGDRVTINGNQTVEVISARDPHGDNRECRIECGLEV